MEVLVQEVESLVVPLPGPTHPVALTPTSPAEEPNVGKRRTVSTSMPGDTHIYIYIVCIMFPNIVEANTMNFKEFSISILGYHFFGNISKIGFSSFD